jgi:hypothetical protein
MSYEVLLLPLGIIYFTLSITLISTGLFLIAQPVLEYGFDIPFFVHQYPYYIPAWLMPFVVIGGILLLVISMHVIRALGSLHGRLAKAMLVRR